ncbi:HEAT repeat domain-containing protein [Pseudanabaena sp. ABRG5-3]|uniref:HEAT repeat domain-containing protein n=1 Tax=Pseudanabaena sp. ABRG5-3 TaxID=685565 RepID=UPI000DC726A6|nr:HEAT repeat domain-containing protein [Pseudanabaena sp. ABRG5-3]BBC22493.1 PBS lyase HEAT domain protein repeat-containing protein [Pseudanabaena sp. ABRG5-3]
MSVEICFDDYLRSVVSAYQQWWRLYTLTDATGRESQRVESDRTAPAFFDFGLMVQTVEPPKAKQEEESEEYLESEQEREKKEKVENKEKIERLPVLEGICKYAADHVLLVGRPGSGKSTALARLLLQEAENALSDRNAKIPVLVELRYLPSEANESSIYDRILAFMHKHDPALDIDGAGIRQLLRQGRLLLLVDGVNELPSDRGRVMVNQFRDLYQKTCPMIFTTRELSAGGDLGIVKRLEMQPLTEPQMQQFVMAYLPTQGERLLRQLSGRLREFGQTPLLLWMLCSLFQQSEQIPPNLGMVFRAFTVGYGDRIKQDVTLSKDSRAWWGRLLQYLAFKMTCGENLTELQVAISRREAEQFLLEFLRGKVEFADDCAVRWLEDLLKHHLIQISNDRIEFRHQLIQEYYAAEWLLGLLPSLSDARLQHDYLNYLKWTEPLALMLELVEGEEQAVRVVRLALEVDLRLGARLAGAVRYGFQEKTVGLLLKEIDRLYIIPNSYTASEILGETKSDFAINNFIQNLTLEDPTICRNAVQVLGKIGSDKAVAILIEAFKDKDSFVRRNVVRALGKIGSNKAVEPLILNLRPEEHPEVRRDSAEALSKIGSTKAVEALIQRITDKTYYVREDIVWALLNIGENELIEPLRNVVKDQIIDPLIQALTDRDSSDVRRDAAFALGEIGRKKAIPFLVQAYNAEWFYYVRKNIAEALGKIGGEESVPFLIQELTVEDLDANANAALTLGKIRSDKAVEPLIQSLTNESPNVRMNIASALGKIGSDKAVEPLIQILSDNNFNVRNSAAVALANIGGEKTTQSLIQALGDKNCDVSKFAAIALGNLGSDKAIKPLIEALIKEDNNMRWLVSEALGNIGSEKNVEALIQVLDHKNPDVRWKTTVALGNISSDRAVEPLIQSLKETNPDIRRSIVEALGKIGSDRAVEPLIQSIEEKDPDIRRNIAEALGKIGSDKAIKPLIKLLKDLDSYVQWKSAEALEKISEADRNLPTLTQQLPYLLTLIPTESSQQALSVITAIQARCKYYNYNIAQTRLPPEDKTNSTTGTTNIFNAPVGQVVAGNLTVHGDNIATQNNQNSVPNS